MIDALTEERADDNHKKEYRAKKALERTISDGNAIATSRKSTATLTEEITARDFKSVAEATEQRKGANAEYTKLMATDAAGMELLGFATNRVNKSYNSKLCKVPPKKVAGEDCTVSGISGAEPPTEALGGVAGTRVSLVQVSAHAQGTKEMTEATVEREARADMKPC